MTLRDIKALATIGLLSVIGLIVLGIVAGCEQRHKAKPEAERTVNEYRYHDYSGEWMWYYVLTTHLNNSNTPDRVYYYSSPTRLTSSNYSTVPFKSESQMSKAELSEYSDVPNMNPVSSVKVSEEEIPNEIQATEQQDVNQAYAEYEQEQNAQDAANNASENPAPSEPTTNESTTDTGSSSSDSGSSGSDSGGSDGGSSD